MPAAENTQTQLDNTQPSPTAGTPMPDDPTALTFQAPDYSQVPVRRRQSDGQEQSADRGREQKNQRRKHQQNKQQQTDRRDRDNDDTSDNDSKRQESKRSNRGKRDEERDHRPMDDEQPVSHRRRRRRRGNIDLEMDGGGAGDPEDTVTRVRAPRQASTSGPDKVTSLRGSTRLEAKRQRRRSTRRGRQRKPVISQAEFLARRESVERKMLVRQHEKRVQIAVLEDGIFAEHFVSNTQQDSLIGNVYLGKVQNVLPSMEAAFVDIGRGRNAVLYAGEVNWDTAQLDGKAKKIENALKSGDSVLVQVTKDPVGHKGARLTAQISLPGRYLVYVPGGTMTGISRKLPDTE
ncbi:MAG TPA: ribonuclease E/G, partial [Enteractinococcus sp.]